MTLILQELYPKNAAAQDILHRNKELARLLRITSRKVRNNPLIIGEPGVGKTALIQGLSYRLKKGANTLTHLKAIEMLDTSKIAMLINSYNIQKLDLEIKTLLSKPKTLYFIDDARLLFQLDNQTGVQYFLQQLLTAKEIYVALACGMAEYRKYVESNPLLSRETENLPLDELNEDQVIDIGTRYTSFRIQETGIRVNADSITQAVGLAERYLTDRQQPDKSLNLIEEGFAKSLIEKSDVLDVSDFKQIIAEKTGIPVETLTVSDKEKLIQLENILNKEILGQSHVTLAISNAIRRARSGLKEPGRPIASFLFLGSSGVGKTETAKVLSRVVYNNERSLLRFDMSEFTEPHTVQRLVGAPPGYIGFEEGGQLTNQVLAQPYSLILLDEIEKAHPKIFDIFLQVMDDGRLTDGKGRTVDFSNTIIIATSNVGVEEILRSFVKNQDVTSKEFYQNKLLPMLGHYFRPEFINRFSDTLVFSPFSQEIIQKIGKLEIGKLKKRMRNLSLELDVDENLLLSELTAIYNPVFGARPIRRYLQEKVENKLALQLLES